MAVTAKVPLVWALLCTGANSALGQARSHSVARLVASVAQLARPVVEERAGPPPGHQIVVVGVGGGGDCFRRLTENWLCSLRAVHVREYVIFSLDDLTTSWLRRAGEPVVHLPSAGGTHGSSDEDFGTVRYIAVTRAKVFASAAVLDLGYDIFFMDVDVAIFQDPRPYLSERADRLGLDMQMQLNYPRKDFNTGIYHARSTPAARRLLAHWAVANATKDDQTVFFAIVRYECDWRPSYFRPGKPHKMAASANVSVYRCLDFPVRVESLPVFRFRTGHFENVRRGRFDEVLVWHANFMVGGWRKHAFLMWKLANFTGRQTWCIARTALCGSSPEGTARGGAWLRGGLAASVIAGALAVGAACLRRRSAGFARIPEAEDRGGRAGGNRAVATAAADDPPTGSDHHSPGAGGLGPSSAHPSR